MKKILMITVLGLIAVAAFVVTTPVLAQDSAPEAPVYGPGWMMGGYYGDYSAMHTIMVELFAGKTGLSVDEVNASLASGMSLSQIAEEQGMSAEDFYAWMAEAHDKALDRAVEQGLLTQEQVDWMQQHYQSMQDYGYGPCRGAYNSPAGVTAPVYRGRGGMMGRFF